MQENKARVTTENGMKNSFGFKNITPEEKQYKVNQVFHSVADKYDLMNDLMSLGMHRLWKDAFVSWLCPPKKENWCLLDVAGGTGDIAFKILKTSQNKIHATILDINASMLETGKKRAQKKGLQEKLSFIEANAENLPFEDNSFDAYTIAFGIRNIPDINRALAEAHRVLKKGGRFMCLEFSEVDMAFLDKIYDYWSFHVIPKIGNYITGDKDAYVYLVESIRKFPNQTVFANIIENAGFRKVSYRNLSGGIATIHSAWKM